MIPTRGLNHLTLRVSNLERSVAFFRDLLGFTVQHRGKTDAYVASGSLWLALLQRPVSDALECSSGMDHFALTVDESDFDGAVGELMHFGVEIVKGPMKRGTGRSVYFLDPDRILIELHTSNLEERMSVWI